jgi:hypothetical protein
MLHSEYTPSRHLPGYILRYWTPRTSTVREFEKYIPYGYIGMFVYLNNNLPLFNDNEAKVYASATRAFDLFQHKARCMECHCCPDFNSSGFHTTGLYNGKTPAKIVSSHSINLSLKPQSDAYPDNPSPLDQYNSLPERLPIPDGNSRRS